MIRRTLSGGRPGRNPFPRRVRGFSIVELMMSVLLVAIGMALALPSYRDMVEKRQVTNAAEQLAAFVNSAQGVAIKTNRVITVSYDRTADDDWCIGAALGTAACDCSETDPDQPDFCEIGAEPFVLNNDHAGNLEVMQAMNGDGAYSFDPIRGFMLDLDDGLTAELRSPNGDFRLNLMVNGTGRVILCSEDSSHSIPGYELCPVEALEEV